MNNHTCLKLEPLSPTDYLKGDGHIIFKGVNPNADWTSHCEFFELQKFGSFETNGCVCFAAQESFDAQMDAFLEIAPTRDLQNQLTAMGYMDTGRDGQPHFHSSARFLQVLTGNGFNGNALHDPWDVLRSYGALPWKDLPFDDTITQAEYLNPISPASLTKAAQFLQLIGGKNAVQYHWIDNNGTKNLPSFLTALHQAPLQFGIAVNEGGYNQDTPADPPAGSSPEHSVLNYQIVGTGCEVLDHYLPFDKTLDAGYPIPFALQGVVNPTVAVPPQPAPTPLPPIPQNVQPTQQNVNLLTQIVNLYKAILSLVKGRKLSGISMNLTNYSVFSSKTFWTQTFQQAYNVLVPLMNVFPNNVYLTLAVNIIGSVLTIYFHVSGVNAAAVSSSTLGKPSNGQS